MKELGIYKKGYNRNKKGTVIKKEYFPNTKIMCGIYSESTSDAPILTIHSYALYPDKIIKRYGKEVYMVMDNIDKPYRVFAINNTKGSIVLVIAVKKSTKKTKFYLQIGRVTPIKLFTKKVGLDECDVVLGIPTYKGGKDRVTVNKQNGKSWSMNYMKARATFDIFLDDTEMSGKYESHQFIKIEGEYIK